MEVQLSKAVTWTCPHCKKLMVALHAELKLAIDTCGWCGGELHFPILPKGKEGLKMPSVVEPTCGLGCQLCHD